MKKLSNTKAELKKKALLIIKACMLIINYMMEENLFNLFQFSVRKNVTKKDRE